ncbi:MAG: TadE/TadG family type IV pilus assembly protein [Actinomycetota bacterium]
MLPDQRDESGSAVVEFALLLPVLLLLLLAVVQVGVLASDRLLLAQAARAGAREAAVQQFDEAIREAATTAGAGLDPERLRLEVTRAGFRGSPVTVSLSYEVPIIGVLAGWLLPATVTISTAATARQEFG